MSRKYINVQRLQTGRNYEQLNFNLQSLPAFLCAVCHKVFIVNTIVYLFKNFKSNVLHIRLPMSRKGMNVSEVAVWNSEQLRLSILMFP